MVGIYKITSPTGKVYIGQSINIENRKTQYINLDKSCIGPKLYNSLKKYDPKNHKFEIIEKCSIEQLNEKEIYWKQYYLEQMNNDWEKVLFCELYDRGGGPRSEAVKNKIKLNSLGKNNKSILQYDLEGNFIKKWHSIKEAENIYGKAIKSVLNGDINTAGKFIWRYENNPIIKENFTPPIHKLSKQVYQIDSTGNIIKIWNSIADIYRELHYPTSNISSCCNNKQKTAYGYKWKYKN
jgi:group I intron endonuclease